MNSPEGRIDRLSADEAKDAAEQCGIPPYMTTLSIFQVLLKNRNVAKPFFDLLGALLFQGQLDVRLRELVIMRTGWVSGSVYEWTQHWTIAQSLGVAAEDLLAVREWQSDTSGRFSPAERAALTAVDEVSRDGEVSGPTFADIAKALGDETHAIELTVLISAYAMVSTILRSLEVPLEEGVPPWPPDGIAPKASQVQVTDDTGKAI